MYPERKKNPAIIAIIVIVLLAAAAGAVYIATRPAETTTNQSTTEDTGTTTNSNSDTPAATSDSSSTAAYKNGTYEATGSYSTPGGRESVDLKVTIEDGKVASTELTGSANSGDSLQYQTRFINGYKSLVVGKNVDEVSLSRVAGSSLTSGGFNDALDQIKTDAKA